MASAAEVPVCDSDSATTTTTPRALPSPAHERAVSWYLDVGTRFDDGDAKACVLSQIPDSNYRDLSLPDARQLTVFCLPDDLCIRGSPPPPQHWSFVLTNESGKRLYGVSLCFYEARQQPGATAPQLVHCARSIVLVSHR